MWRDNQEIVAEQQQDQKAVRRAHNLRDAVRGTVRRYLASLNGKEPAEVYNLVLEEMEAPLLQEIFCYTGGNESKTARWLGLARGTVRKKLRHHDITRESLLESVKFQDFD